MDTHSLVIVHEDGATVSADGLSYEAASKRFEMAARTLSVVYAHFSDDSYGRLNHYTRQDD